MYDWHKTHHEKLTRFRMAMDGVTQCGFRHEIFLAVSTLTNDGFAKLLILETHFSTIGLNAIRTEAAL